MKPELTRYIKKENIQTNMFQYVVDVVKKGGSMYNYKGVVPSKPNINVQKSNCGVSASANPTMSQFMFHQMCMAIANGYDAKGLLGWFSTGAGKTVVSASIYDAFDKNKKFYYISRHDSLKPHSEIHKYLKTIWKNNTSLKDFKQNFHIMSIASFSNKVHNNAIALKNCCIIVDEAQYLFSSRAVPTMRKKHEMLIETLKKNKTDSCHVFILTATPGDTIEEMISLMNIINKDVITEQNYKKYIKHNILFLDMYKDRSLFPTFDINDAIIVNMSELQKQKYKEKEKTSKNNTKILQKWSNELYTNNGQFSNKVKKVYEYINSHVQQKHYVYSQYYKQGIQDVMKYLETKGYQRVTQGNMNKKGKKYILAKASEKFKASDKENPLLGKFNSSENKTGEFIQVFLATDSYNTGLDLKAVRHVHMLEPFSSFLEKKQAIGRAGRLCSHSQLPFSDWKVKVHQYVSRIDGTPAVDEAVMKKAEASYKEYSTKVKDIKNSSVDCKVMAHFHNQGLKPTDEDYRVCIEGNPYRDVYETKQRNKILNMKNRKVIEEKLMKKRAELMKMKQASLRAKKLKEDYLRFQKGINIIKKQFLKKKEDYKRAIQMKNKLVFTKGIVKLKELMKRIQKKKKEAALYSRKMIHMKKILNKKKKKMLEEKMKQQEKIDRLKKLKQLKQNREQRRKNAIRQRYINEQRMKKKLYDIRTKAKTRLNTGMVR